MTENTQAVKAPEDKPSTDTFHAAIKGLFDGSLNTVRILAEEFAKRQPLSEFQRALMASMNTDVEHFRQKYGELFSDSPEGMTAETQKFTQRDLEIAKQFQDFAAEHLTAVYSTFSNGAQVDLGTDPDPLTLVMPTSREPFKIVKHLSEVNNAKAVNAAGDVS